MRSKITRSLGPEIKGLLFISPWIVGLLWFYLYPFLASLYYSFHNATAFGPGAFIGFRNYELIMRDVLEISGEYNLFYRRIALPRYGSSAITCLAATKKRSRRVGLSNDFLSAYGGPIYCDLRDLDLDSTSSLWLAKPSSRGHRNRSARLVE
jgi:ABC-type sugar transport system permease subunit